MPRDVLRLPPQSASPTLPTNASKRHFVAAHVPLAGPDALRMVDISRYRADDRSAIEAMQRRAFGDARTEALQARWSWLYESNPQLAGGAPFIWVARVDGQVAGLFATIPVRLSVFGTEIDANWGSDVLVAPEQQGKGFGDALFRAWDSGTGAAIGLSLTDASHRLFQKLKWPYIGTLPRFAKPLSPGAIAKFTRTERPLLERMALGWRRRGHASRRAAGTMERITRFDDRATRLWERVAPTFAFAARRDATYLNWRYADAPGAPYLAALLVQGGEAAGLVVYRHVDEDAGRATILVDFLADPSATDVMATMLAWVEGEARAKNADVLRAFASHAQFQAALRDAGLDDRPSTLRFVAKVNGCALPPDYYASTDRWHVTRGDSDGDR